MTDTATQSITETTDIEGLEKMATTTTKKKTYYTAHYSEFVQSESNLRRDVKAHAKDTGLYQQIKADGGVREICFVLPSKQNIEGKRVLHEGNTRHFVIKDLDLNDPEYTGSRDIPFLIIPDDIADKPAELVKFMLSANGTDKRISPQEQWNGIKQLIDIYEVDYPGVKDPRNEAGKQVALELGKSSAWLQAMRRVYETSVDKKILAYLEDGTIPSVDYADKIQAKVKKLVIPLDTLITEILECAIDDGKTKISNKFIEQACDRLTVDKNELLADLTEDKASQEKVQKVTDDGDDEEEETEDQRIKTTAENTSTNEGDVESDRRLAIDNLRFFADYLSELSEADYALIPNNALIIASNKVDAVYNKFAKYLQAPKITDSDNVEVVEVDDIENIEEVAVTSTELEPDDNLEDVSNIEEAVEAVEVVEVNEEDEEDEDE